jgi:hypothetical protein
MSKVFILNRGAHDYSAAERYGDLVYVTDGLLSKLATGVMYRTLEDALSDSSPQDYILLSSLTTLCSLAVAMFAVLHGRVNLLIYHQDGYVLRKIMFNKSKEHQNGNG